MQKYLILLFLSIQWDSSLYLREVTKLTLVERARFGVGRRQTQVVEEPQPITSQESAQLEQVERQRRAAEQRRIIDQRIAMLEGQLQEETQRFNQFANQMTNSQQAEFNARSESLRELRERTEIRVGELRNAKSLATGEFTTESVVSVAEGRSERTLQRGQLVAQQRLEAREKLVSEGIPQKRAVQISSGGRITVEEAQRLTPQTRKSLGIEIKEVKTPVRQPTQAELQSQMSIANTATRNLKPLKANTTEKLLTYKIRDVPAQVITKNRPFYSEDAERQYQLFLNPNFKGAVPRPDNLKSAQPIKEKTITGVSAKELEAQMSIPKTSAKEKFISGIESDIGKTGERLQLLREQKGFKPKVERALIGFSIPIGSAVVAISRPIKTVKGVGKSIVGFVKSPSGKGKEFITNIKTSAKEDPIAFGGGLAGQAAISLVGAKAIRSAKSFATKPLVFKDPIKSPTFQSKAKVSTLIKEGKQVDVASFQLRGLKQPRTAVVIPRYKEAFSKVVRVNTADRQSARVLAGGERIVIEKPKASITQTGTIIIKKGQIVNKAPTITIAGTAQRSGKIVVSRLEGGMRGIDKELGLTDVSRLPKSQQRSLQKIAEDISGRPVSAKNVGKVLKKSKVEFGDVKGTELFKLGNKQASLIPRGKRTTRGEIIGLPKDKVTIETSNKFGLKEIQLIDERLAVSDTTFPRFRAAKNVGLIRGKTTRKLYELPASSDPISFKKGVRPKREGRQFQVTDVTQVLRKPIAQSALTQAKLLKSKPLSNKQIIKQAGFSETQRINNLPLLVGGGGKAQSKFASSGFDIREMESVRITSPVSFKPLTRNIPNTITKEVVRSTSRQLPKTLNREVSRLVPREIAKDITRQTTRQVTRLAPRLVQRQVPRTPTRPTPRLTPPRSPPRGTFKPPVLFTMPKGKGKSSTGSLGFKTFVIKGGKEKFLSGVRPKGLALRLGEKEALGTLRATFGVRPTKVRVRQKDISFTPSSDIFRGFKIKQGKRIPLQDTFIQKKGKRLITGSEIKSIQLARMKI